MNDVKTATEAGAAIYTAGKTAGAAATKHTVVAAGAGLTLAAITVMTMTMPRGRAEFFVALISTVVSSFSGGAWLILHFEMYAPILAAANDLALWLSVAKLGGVFFICGLPGWVLVRSAFVFSERRKGKGLDVFIRDIRKALTR